LTYTLNVDLVPPFVVYVSPQDGQWLGTTTIGVEATVSGGPTGLDGPPLLTITKEDGTEPPGRIVLVMVEEPSKPGVFSAQMGLVTRGLWEQYDLLIELVAVDGVGNSVSSTIRIHVDLRGPGVVHEPWSGWFTDEEIRFNWSCDDGGVGMGDSSPWLSWEAPEVNGTLLSSLPVVSGGSVSASVLAHLPESPGVEATMICEDAFGNVGWSGPHPVLIDRTPPTLESVVPNSSLTLVGAVHEFELAIRDDGSGVRRDGVDLLLSTDNGSSFFALTSFTFVTLAPGSFLVQGRFTLTEGEANLFLVRATDEAGHMFEVADPIRFTVNRPPTLEIISPADGVSLASGTLFLEARASDPDGDLLAWVWSDRSTGRLLANDSTAVVTLEPGGHVLRVSISDGSGHTVSQDVNVWIREPEKPPLVVEGGLEPWIVLIVVAGAAAAGFALWVRRRRR
jgi:hypothetical protein